MVNIVCMKWGTAYGPHYVNRLYRGVARHLSRPFRFVCFTDDETGVEPPVECKPMLPITLPPGRETSAFNKLSLFAPTVEDLTGPTLFLDLDVVIVGALDDFFGYEGDFCIIHNWIEWWKTLLRKRPHIGNSSVFRFTIGEQTHVLDAFHAHTQSAFDDYPTEQAFMTDKVGAVTFWPESWCRSFKRHCMPMVPFNLISAPRLPDDAKIIVFHGRPNPDEAAAGFAKGWRKSTRPARWIDENWQ